MGGYVHTSIEVINQLIEALNVYSTESGGYFDDLIWDSEINDAIVTELGLTALEPHNQFAMLYAVDNSIEVYYYRDLREPAFVIPSEDVDPDTVNQLDHQRSDVASNGAYYGDDISEYLWSFYADELHETLAKYKEAE